MRARIQRRGSALLEFVLTGIPMIFVWISIVQMSIGMWHYHTLQYAVKTTAAFITHHGIGCAYPNSCAIRIKDAASVMKANAIGLAAREIHMTFTAYKSDHETASVPVSCALDSCLSNAAAWPPAGFNEAGSDIQIKADYVFRSALCMFAPGSEPVRFG